MMTTKNEQQSGEKYWQSLDEFHRGGPEITGEFFKSPINDAGKDENLDSPSRREFLKLMGAGFALMGASACTRRPVEKIVPYVKKPEDVMPGVEHWYASTCRECPSACGILVRSREGRPVKFEGNPKHPSSQGGLCARGQASVLNLYDPDRLQAPVKPARQGLGVPMNWDGIDAEVLARLRSAQAAGGRVRVLTGELSSPSTEKLIGEFVKGFGAGSHVVYETLGTEEIAAANELAFGRRVVPHYHFEKANLVVGFGADFLGTWLSPVEFSRGFAAGRKPGKSLSRLVVFESTVTLTGSNADARYRLKSGDEYKAALALAYELIVASKRSKFAGDSTVQTALAPFAPAGIASQLGIPASVFHELAEALWEKRGTSLVVGGGFNARGDDGVALEIAVNLLNSALENEGKTIDGVASPASARSSWHELVQLIDDMKAGRVDVLLVHGTNPAYSLPPSLGFVEAMGKVKTVVNFSTHLNETGKLSDYNCAIPHHTEAWGDASRYLGEYSVQQPTIAPLYKTRDFEESLMAWARQLKFTGAIATEPSWHDYLLANWSGTIFREAHPVSAFPEFWDNALREGVVTSKKGAAAAARTFRTTALANLPKLGWTRDLTLALYPKISQYDGRNANNGWLQELPDPVTRICWDNYASISPKLAADLKVNEGDVVRVRTGLVSLELPAHIQPGMHDQSIAVAEGYGRAAGRVGDGVGINVAAYGVAGKLALRTSGLVVNPEKTAKSQKLACVQGHHSMEGRSIVRETTLKEFEENPKAGNEEHEKLTTIWKEWKYPGYRWGMAIDLNSCTGCGACVIGCQSENNVPIVGKKLVLDRKEMHWIRIDRYYAGKAVENPRIVFQPVMCQHCENAPCETVCPVLAAVHSSEGLNQQVYNRCVGTRYCENNCPYKVRRFNWFDFTDVAKPLNLAYNPDLTVRSRGVMEKCTFCIQRITAAKDHAKDLGRKVSDGEMKTACQQSCPTQAITFGDINDKSTLVSRIKEDARGYHLLEEINVRSSVTYLTKVRNTES